MRNDINRKLRIIVDYGNRGLAYDCSIAFVVGPVRIGRPDQIILRSDLPSFLLWHLRE